MPSEGICPSGDERHRASRSTSDRSCSAPTRRTRPLTASISGRLMPPAPAALRGVSGRATAGLPCELGTDGFFATGFLAGGCLGAGAGFTATGVGEPAGSLAAGVVAAGLTLAACSLWILPLQAE